MKAETERTRSDRPIESGFAPARPIKSRRKACTRLADLFDTVTLKREGRGFRIHIDGANLPPAHKSTKHTLAFLADLARAVGMEQAKVQGRVRWIGRVPSKGLSAWQEYALAWLQGNGG